MRALRFVTIAGIPFLVAAAAAVLYPFWILGIPGSATAPYAQGWFIGYMALSLYLPVYGIGLLALGVLRLFRWPLSELVHGLIWLCMAAFFVAMGLSVSKLS